MKQFTVTRRQQRISAASATFPMVYSRTWWGGTQKTWNRDTMIHWMRRTETAPQFPNMMDLGGGIVEEEERRHPQQAVLREIGEEKGLDLSEHPLFFGISTYTRRGSTVGNWLYWVPVRRMYEVNWERVRQFAAETRTPVEHNQDGWMRIEDVLGHDLAFKHWEVLSAMCLTYGDADLIALAQYHLNRKQVEIVFN